MSPTSVLLPLPLTPVTATKHPSGISTSISLRLCSRAPRTASHASPGSRRSAGTSILRLPDRYCPVIDCFDFSTSLTVPDTMISPPCSPAPGPMSTTWSATRIVSSSCSTTITVLPRLRRRIERLDEPAVVALVQTDRRLVEHVEHADEPAADLRREPDALRFTARERSRRAVERQVVEADVEHELQPLEHLLEHALGDEAIALRQLDGLEERRGNPRSTARRPRRCSGRRSSPPATRAAAARRRTRGTARAACSPRSRRGRDRSRTPCAGARPTARRLRTSWRTSAAARTGSCSGRSPASRPMP